MLSPKRTKSKQKKSRARSVTPSCTNSIVRHLSGGTQKWPSEIGDMVGCWAKFCAECERQTSSYTSKLRLFCLQTLNIGFATVYPTMSTILPNFDRLRDHNDGILFCSHLQYCSFSFCVHVSSIMQMQSLFVCGAAMKFVLSLVDTWIIAVICCIHSWYNGEAA